MKKSLAKWMLGACFALGVFGISLPAQAGYGYGWGCCKSTYRVMTRPCCAVQRPCCVRAVVKPCCGHGYYSRGYHYGRGYGWGYRY